MNVCLNFFLNQFRFSKSKFIAHDTFASAFRKYPRVWSRKIWETFETVSRRRRWEIVSTAGPFGGFASLRSQRQTMRRSLDVPRTSTIHLHEASLMRHRYLWPSTYCQTYWASANGRGHARNSWIFKQVTKQSSFALAPAPGTDTPPGHQAVPYYLIAYWAEMELSYSVQLRARVRTPEPICDQESPSEENLTLSHRCACVFTFQESCYHITCLEERSQYRQFRN